MIVIPEDPFVSFYAIIRAYKHIPRGVSHCDLSEMGLRTQ